MGETNPISARAQNQEKQELRMGQEDGEKIFSREKKRKNNKRENAHSMQLDSAVHEENKGTTAAYDSVVLDKFSDRFDKSFSPGPGWRLVKSERVKQEK